MLHEDANDGIGKNHGNVFVACAQPAAGSCDCGLNGGAVGDVDFDGRGNQGSRGQRFDSVSVQRTRAAPTGRGHAIRRDFEG